MIIHLYKCACVSRHTHTYSYISVPTHRLVRASPLHVYIRRILRFGVCGRPSADEVKGRFFLFVRVSACASGCVCLFALVRPERVLTCSLPRRRSLGVLVSTHVQPAAPRGERRVRRVDLRLRRSRKVPAAVRGVLTRYSGSSPRGTRSTHTQARRPHGSLLQSLSSRNRYP
jgi:hypothetical protein